MDTFHFFVCRNGYGHQKRVFSVVYELIKYKECKRVTIHCNKEIYNKTQSWNLYHTLLVSKKVQFEFELMENAPQYLKELSIESVHNWLDEINEPCKKIVGTIVIDNDISLLSIFPHAIVMGSFFWKDIVDHEKHSDLIAFENQLLQNIRPVNIGVKKMAMKNVREMPFFVGLPWFTTPSKCRNLKINERKGVLVTGGGTGEDKDKLVEFASILLSQGENIFVDSMLHVYSNKELPLFSFKEVDFCRLKAVICRPGMGILNDCVAHGIPIFAMEILSNEELLHNAMKIEELEIGKKVRNSIDVLTILNQNELMDKYQQHILEQELEGAAQAAKYLIKGNKYEN